jgi:hypothetical protein
MSLIRQLWRDQRGFLATTGLILLATIVVLGTIVGLVAFRNQVVQEFGDASTAVGRLNQSYQYTGCGVQGISPHWVSGSSYQDNPDFGDDPDPINAEPAGISVQGAALTESQPLPPFTPYP